MSTSIVSLNLIDLDYYMDHTNQKINIRLFTKGINNQSVILVINDYFPYFYIESSAQLNEVINNSTEIRSWFISQEETEKKLYFGGNSIKVTKLIGKIPYQIPKIAEIFRKHSIEVYEADIPFIKRFLIDRSIFCLQAIQIELTEEQVDRLDQRNLVEISYKDVKPVKTDERKKKFHLTYLAFDIEVAAEEETVQQLFEKSEKRIIAISICYGSLVDEYKTEAEILKKDENEAERNLIYWFLDKVNEQVNPDIIITYNGDLFDFPYLVKRMGYLNIPTHLLSVSRTKRDALYYQQGIKSFRIKGRVSVDLFYKTWGLHPTSGKKTLNNIAEMKLGISKEERPENFYKIWQDAVINKNKESYEKLFAYSKRDAELTYLLFEPLEQLAQIDAVKFVGMPSADGIATTARNIGEFELFRVCYKNKVLIPMLPTPEEIRKRQEAKRKDPHKGGLVLEPQGDFYESVGIFDFRSMYPSIISVFNIGGESYSPPLSGDTRSVEKHFLGSPRASLAEMMSNVLKERVKYKIAYQNARKNEKVNESEIESLKRRSFSLKLVLNSTFGSSNYPRGRFFSKKISDSITEIGRSYIRWLQDTVKDFNPEYEVIYGDTDSVFVWFKNNSIPEIKIGYESNDEEIKKVAYDEMKLFVDYLNSKLKKPLELELEQIVYRMAFKKGRRKAYSFADINGNLTVKGFEAVRGDWSILAREAQTKILHTLLTLPKGGDREAKKVLLTYVNKLKTLPQKELIDQVVIYSPIKRPPSKYKNPIPVVGAFIHYCKEKKLDPEMQWKEFDKIPWVITPGKGNLNTRARHPEFASKVDRFHYIDEIIRAAERFGINLSLSRISNSRITLNKYIDSVTQTDIKRAESKKNLKSQNSGKETNILTKFLKMKD